MDGGVWWAVVHGVAKSWARLSDFTFPFHFHALEKEMATHSSVLAWRIPGMGEPGGLQSMGSHRVGHDWSDLAAAGPSSMWRLKVRYIWFECCISIVSGKNCFQEILIEWISARWRSRSCMMSPALAQEQLLNLALGNGSFAGRN